MVVLMGGNSGSASCQLCSADGLQGRLTLFPSIKRLQTRVDAGWGHPDRWLWCSIEMHWWRVRLVGWYTAILVRLAQE